MTERALRPRAAHLSLEEEAFVLAVFSGNHKSLRHACRTERSEERYRWQSRENRVSQPGTLADLSDKMRDIDFAMLSTHAEGGEIAGRPMTRRVAYEGDR